MLRGLWFFLIALAIAGCQPPEPSNAKLEADFADQLDPDARPYVEVHVENVLKQKIAEDRIRYTFDVTWVRNGAAPDPADLPLLRSQASTELATARFGGHTRTGAKARLILSPQGTKETHNISADYVLRDGAWSANRRDGN